MLCIASGAFAQAIQNPFKVRAVGDAQAADSLDLYSILHANAPGDFPGSGVPGVTVVTPGGKFVLGVGGFVKAIAGWDIGYPIESPDEFITSQIPMTPRDGDGSRFNLSARQTHLYINGVFLPGSKDQIGVFIGANLLSAGYTPVLQYGYLRYRGIKAGYDDSYFSDPPCGAPTVDYEGPCSNTTSPVGGISYTWTRGQWEAGTGIELPQTSFTTAEGHSKAVYQRVPDIPVAARYSWNDGGSWVRVSGIFRNMAYRTTSNHNAFGYGVQVSGAENLLDRFTFYWQALWGRGIASLIQDTAGEGLDLVPAPEGDSLKPVPVWGGFMALQYNACSRCILSATYSHLRAYAARYSDGDTPWPELYKYTQYFCANAFFEATHYLEVGAEYIWGRRADRSGLKHADNRIQASLQLTF